MVDNKKAFTVSIASGALIGFVNYLTMNAPPMGVFRSDNAALVASYVLQHSVVVGVAVAVVAYLGMKYGS